jgi:hypothetical protein
MKNTINVLLVRVFGIIALVAAIGFSMVACGGDNDGGGGGGNTDPKTLLITMSSTIFSQGSSGFSVGVFPAGTTVQQASNMTGLIAGCTQSTPGVNSSQSGSNYIVTLPLYVYNGNTRWTGSGTFDVYAILGSSNFYKAGSVNISSATTNITISASNAVQ